MTLSTDLDADYSHVSIAQTVEASGSVITVQRAREYLRLTEDETDHDDWIELAIKAATEYVEGYTNRSLLTQQFDVYFDRFPLLNGEIELPKPPC